MANPVSLGMILAGLALVVAGVFSTGSCAGAISAILVGVGIAFVGIGATLPNGTFIAIFGTVGSVVVIYGVILYLQHAVCLIY